MQRNTCALASMLLLGAAGSMAAPPDRITRPVDTSRTSVVPGPLHRLAQPQFDLGAIDPGQRMNYLVLLVKPSAAQQSDLDRLLVDQQNPSSPAFRNWLTPEQFGNRFGLSSSDQSKVVAWLNSEGFSLDRLARSGNWMAFSGTAAQVSNALHTPIHRFQVAGETHFANTSEPSVPEALADVVGGFLGLNDFRPQPFVQPIPPDDTIGAGSHYLAPEDFATIYDVAPLYAAGIDGTGQSIAVVGESDVSLNDLRAFRTRYNLPANDPNMILYGGTDPGFNGAQTEGDLDLEWAGAIAPHATIDYIYGSNVFTAIVVAVEMNAAPVITISYGYCEIDFSPLFYRAIAQQGNAQGITILSASGDSGAGACQGYGTFATGGPQVAFPAVLPEVTGVGGTQFAEGSGNYWSPTNSANSGSALSYIPETAWSESGGGASAFYSKPAWQAGPGVTNDNARDVPDVALSAALHDGYFIESQGANFPVAGTSCAAPSMAAIVALLNHYQVSNGFQKQPGLGNINPQLYRLAQSVPSAFHDITSGNNIVQCAQGSPDCLTGSFGYSAGPGYDMATGLGSVDANTLVTKWNTATNGVVVTLSASANIGTLNDTIQLTATVAAATGGGAPTGAVNFVFNTVAFGTVALAGGSASVSLPLYRIGFAGVAEIAAEYSGDASFSSGGAKTVIQIMTPSGAAAIVPSAPNTVWASQPDAQGPSWQTTILLRDMAGVPALVTGLTIDGETQSLPQYFPSPDIPAESSLSANFVFRGLAVPLTRTFGFTGVDASGNIWSRQVSVNYLPVQTYDDFSLSATPLTVTENPAADRFQQTCQWPVQLNVNDLGGYGNLVTSLLAGSVNLSSQIASIFGTTRLAPWGGLQGTVCFAGIVPPATDSIQVGLTDGVLNLVVSFAAPPVSPAVLSTAPPGVSLAAASASQPVQTTLAVNISDKTQTWTAAIYPANRTTSWLSASQLSGTGPAQITLTASGTGFEPGVYRATIVFESANAAPQYIDVPVMFVLGGSTSGTSIAAVANAASYKTTVSPGMLLGIFGANLANATSTASGNPLPYSLAGASVTVNGVAAPILYASPTFLDIQVPYEAGAGPAVMGVNNRGQIAAFQFEIAPSSPGIFADANGNLVPRASVQQGGYTSLYVTGMGDVSPAINDGYSPFPTTPLAFLPKPLLPLSVTVGGVPAFVQFVGISAGLVGAAQINILVPASVPLGNQPVVITVGGVPSAPVNVVVQAAASP